MYQSDTEILFPMRVTPFLRNLRGDAWRDLVDRVINAVDGSIDQLAFSLLLIRLSGCLTCHPHSYRAMRGCSVCAKHAILRFRGQDDELLELFNFARADVDILMEKGHQMMVARNGSLIGGK